MSKIDTIFIVGTGRSGTHFTCDCLRGVGRLEDFLEGKEHHATLYAVADAAMRHSPFPFRAHLHYVHYMWRARLMGKILVDQQHPNLFYVDRLAQLYPRAVFIYPDRSAVQIVASMLNHDGVGGWYGKLKSGTLDVPYPNRFFGIESREQLMTEPLHLLCLRRVAAHKLAATEARRRHGQRFRYLNYEALVRDRLGALREVFSPSEFLQFGEHQQTTESNISSLEKYKSALTDSQIEEIESLEARLGFA